MGRHKKNTAAIDASTIQAIEENTVDLTEIDLESLSEEEKYRLKRNLVFEPCYTKEALHQWIFTYLGLNIPDGYIYNGTNASNSSPMDMIWRVYSMMLFGRKEEYKPKILAYASRDSFKTLAASVLEVLAVLHLRCSVAHMAAIKSQSAKAQQYVFQFFAKDYIRDFMVGSNDTMKTVARYVHKDTKDNISSEEYKALPKLQQVKYEYIENYIRIIIATISGSNCVDLDSLIDTPDGKKSADSIKEGDEIVSLDLESNKVITQRVKEVVYNYKKTMRLHLSDGGSLVVTEDHPILTDSGWTRARAIMIGDKCAKINENAPPVNNESTPLQATHPIHNPWSVLLGSLMGDASMTWPKNKAKQEYGKGPRWACSHADGKKEYLSIKATALGMIGEKAAFVDNGKQQTKVSSGVSGAFADIYRELYPNGKKTITRQFLDRLDEESLAYWFMDDGVGNSVTVGDRTNRNYTIATCGFSIDEHQIMIDWLKERFGLEATLYSVSNQSKKVYPVLKFDRDNSQKLTRIIDQYVVPCMRYKMTLPDEFADTRCIGCGEAVSKLKRNKFSFCDKCTSNKKKLLDKRVGIEKRLVVEIVKKEFLGERPVVDIVVDTKKEHRKNFICNDVVAHNSEHVPFLVVDEVDLITEKRRAYEEAMMIPSEKDGMLPVVLLTSSRKFSFGLVQEELDKNKSLEALHWNIIDITDTCPPTRHLPDEKKVKIWVNDEDLQAISQDQYEELPFENRGKFYEDVGYAGCLKNCKIFASCKGLLAHRPPQPTNKGKMVKSPANTESAFERTELSMAKAQLLCWKPSSEGLVYPYFSEKVHTKTPSQAADLLGVYLPEGASKKDFIQLMRRMNAEPIAGIDWGFTHPWVVVVGWRLGNRMVVTDCLIQKGLDATEQLDQFQKAFGSYQPIVYADPESPQNILTFKRAGFNMKEWKKGAGSIAGGIEIVRRKMRPTLGGQPELVFLDCQDKAMAQLIERVKTYHYKTDAGGDITDVPMDEDDDEMDALRYLVMNAFAREPKASVSSVKHGFAEEEDAEQHQQVRSIIDKLEADSEDIPLTQITKKGKFIFAG